MLKVNIYEYDSPCGTLLLAVKRGKLCLCSWKGSKRTEAAMARLSKLLNVEFVFPDEKEKKPSSKTITLAIKQLNQYFSKRRKSFNVPYLEMGTEFQKKVWNNLKDVPYGKTTSYADIAKEIEEPEAIRAVANVCGDNALSLIIPCHRAIGSDGSLVGYAGGLPVKRFLIDMESTQQSLPFKDPVKKKSVKPKSKVK
ncbi:MAG: methylated-DNA--[protein]-cysteine S-methyltransferase [Bacteroidales bacterium]|nr:methylated-DNA--[protein]-cysteine S-methyltransferase [Bacteroidales bacterium]